MGWDGRREEGKGAWAVWKGEGSERMGDGKPWGMLVFPSPEEEEWVGREGLSRLLLRESSSGCWARLLSFENL